MKILITGSREWLDPISIMEVFERHPNDEFIFGDCPSGADVMAWCFAIAKGVKYKRYIAHWNMYGLIAGSLRNEQMVCKGPDLCYGFLKGKSKGTRNCLSLCNKAKIKTHIIDANEARKT